MDAVLAQILICNVGVRRELARLKSERRAMTPNIKGLSSALAKMKHDLDTEAGKLIAKVEGAGARGLAAIKQGHAVVDAALADVKEVEDFAKSLVGHNGGDPISDGSQESSTNSGHDGEPGKSWAGGAEKPSA